MQLKHLTTPCTKRHIKHKLQFHYLHFGKTKLCWPVEVFPSAVDVHRILILPNSSVDIIQEQAAVQHVQPAFEACRGVFSIQAVYSLLILQQQDTRDILNNNNNNNNNFNAFQLMMS